MSKKTKEVAVQETKQVDSFIDKAIAVNAPVETLERLFALHEKVEARNAKAQFVQAVADFQKDCPKIEKSKKVNGKDGKLRYQYAPLDAIHDQIKEHVAKHGLSYRWDVEQPDGEMKVTVTLTHVGGHSETSTLSIPIDSDGYMTQPQKYASAQTYAKRYTLLNVLGITTADEDTDATDVGEEPDAKSPKAKIVLRLKQLGFETNDKVVIEEKVLELTKLKLVEKNFDEIVTRLTECVKEKQEYDNSKV